VTILAANEELGVEQELKEEVEGVLARIRPSLGGADVQLRDISQGIVTLQYRRLPSNASACHVDRTRTTKEVVAEVLDDELKRVVPGFRKVTLIGEE
jgi:Fe-S cluster biogenesis protein NfuA